MKRILSSKWGKMEICAGLFGLIGFLALFLALTISNTHILNHTAQAQGAPAASVTTDKADYAADDMVMITGSRWQPGETVTLEIVEDPVIHDPDTLYAVADADGNISNEYIIHGHDVVQTFTLTASGMTSGLVSQATFTNSLNSTSTASLPTTPTTDPTVMTDKEDYVPGETVLITGSGWEPGETVALELVEEPLIHPAETLYAIADDAGNITNAEYVIQDHDLGQSFTLTATGQTSGLQAVTTFTDHTPVPSFLTATAVPPSTINLTWDGPTNTTGVNANHDYHIERCLGTGCTSFLEIATFTPDGGGTNDYSDTGLSPGIYRYRVRYHHHPATAVFGSYSPIAEATLAAADTTPPSITCPTNITEEADQPGGKNVAYTVPTATDDVDPNPTESCSPSSGSLFPLGTTQVTCTATDASNNSAQCTFDVIVQDTTPPSIICPSDITEEADQPGGKNVAYTVPTATDIVDSDPDESCSPSPGSLFPLGTTQVTCTATDDSNNSAQCTFNVTVQDTTPPSITCPADMTVEGNTTGGANVPYTVPTATDIVDSDPTENCTPAPNSFFALGGPHQVTCTATDDSNNSASCSFNVTVQDTTPPSITCPADISGIVGQPISLGSPTVSDIVDPSPTVSNNAPGTFPPGMTTVTWTATDDSLNSASCNQKVTLTYIFMGFFPPVDNLPTINMAKAGQGIPFKWSLKDYNGNFVSDLATVMSYGYGSVPCMNGTTDAIESYDTTGSSGLRYDMIDNQFIFTSQTLKSWAGYCKTFTLMLIDGTKHQANFKFK